MTAKQDLIYKSTIKEVYGLPDSWIKRLGEPDKVVQNPHYRSGPPSALYERARVEALIDQQPDEYQELQKRRATLQARAKGVADRRRLELVNWAETIAITPRGKLPQTLKQLERDTVEAFVNFRVSERRDFSPEFTMSRNALIAHLRHNYTNYENLLSQLEGKVGCGDAYYIIRVRCDELAEGLLNQYESALEEVQHDR